MTNCQRFFFRVPCVLCSCVVLVVLLDWYLNQDVLHARVLRGRELL